MMYYAIAVFVLAYAFIISERFNKTTVALVGAGLMVFLPVMDSPDVFYSQDNGIDWDVIFLMLGMMMIVSILRQTGVFEYVAIWAVKRANGSPLRIMMLLMVVMAFASAILPNVVSVLLIAPVTLLVCDALEINPVPLLMAEVFASNVGGAATLVGDPPNIIIGARKALSFNAFLVNMAPIVVIVMLVLLALTPVMFRGLSAVSAEKSLTSCRSKRVTPSEIVGCSSGVALSWSWCWPVSSSPQLSTSRRRSSRCWARAFSS
jgi:Na+/H+ antiporter NhaD/arsenite permease-like protein